MVIAIVLVVGSIGAYYGYQYYMNQKFDESFKLHYYNTFKAEEYANATLNDNTTYTNQQEWEAGKNATIENWNKAIDYQKKAINYEEDMVKYSPNNAYKKYSELLLKINKDYLQELELYLQSFNLIVYPGVVTNQTKMDQLKTQKTALNNDMESLAAQKDQIKLQNPDLNKRVDDLSNETQTVIQ